jgi:hypothetical protein
MVQTGLVSMRSHLAKKNVVRFQTTWFSVPHFLTQVRTTARTGVQRANVVLLRDDNDIVKHAHIIAPLCFLDSCTSVSIRILFVYMTVEELVVGDPSLLATRS